MFRKQKAAPLKAWDQQPEESDAAYAAFKLYITLPHGRKDMGEIARLAGTTRGTVYGWSSRFRWREREAAFVVDQEQTQIELSSALLRDPRREIVNDMLLDYQSMLLEWRTLFTRLTSKEDELTAKDMKMLVEMRDEIDQMARRAAKMPGRFNPEPEDKAPAKNEPKQLNWGESTPNAIRLEPSKVRDVTDDGDSEQRQYISADEDDDL